MIHVSALSDGHALRIFYGTPLLAEVSKRSLDHRAHLIYCHAAVTNSSVDLAIWLRLVTEVAA
jgi:hypothetical protein